MRSSSPSGTQSIARAIRLMKVVATGRRPGWRLTDLAAACSLEPATAHRILERLVAERLMVRDDERHYLPGPLLFELGLSHSKPLGLIEATRPALAAIAREFRAVGTLWLLSDCDVVCADRVGQAGTRVFVDVGTRRPVASMAPGLSMLLEMTRARRRILLTENLARMEDLFPGRMEDFRAMIDRSERAGYGISYNDVGPGIFSIGAALTSRPGRPVAALALIGSTADLPVDRVDRLTVRLGNTAAKIAGEHTALLARLP